MIVFLLLSILITGCGDENPKEVHADQDTPTTPTPKPPKPVPDPSPLPLPPRQPEVGGPIVTKKTPYSLVKDAFLNWFYQLDDLSQKIFVSVFLFNDNSTQKEDMNEYINSFISFCDSHTSDCKKEVYWGHETIGLQSLLIGFDQWWNHTLTTSDKDRKFAQFFGKTIPVIKSKLQ